MVRPVAIRGVHTHSWHPELQQIIYGHLRKYNRNQMSIHPENFRHLPGNLAVLASLAAAVQAAWQKKISRVSLTPECEVPVKKAFRLKECRPAGVTFTPHHTGVCRNYLCCPFCFYRKVQELADMLYSQVTPNSELAAVVRSVSPLRSYFPDQLTLVASLRMMRDLTTSEQFVGGVSFRYLTKNKEGTWCVVIIFVGVLPKNIPLRNDKGLSWVKYPSTETGIRMILTNHIRYPSPVLTEDIDPVVWTGLLNHLRHMRSGKVINRKKASKHVYNLQRSSHTSEDLGLTPRPALRQLLQLRPSSALLPRKLVQSGIGG